MIQDKFRSAKKQKEISELVIENFKKRQDRTTLEKRWSRFYNLYRGIETKGTYRGRADLDWASAFLVVEILTPRIFNALFPRVKWFDIVGVEQSDEKQAQIMAAYLRQIYERDVHFRRKMIPLLRYCAMLGTMIGKTPYRKEKKKVPVKTAKTFQNLYGLFQPDFQITEKITFDSIDLEPVDIFDFYPADDFIDNIQDQPFVLHKTIEYADLLYRKKYNKEDDTGLYENLDKINLENIQKQSVDNTFKDIRKQMIGLITRDRNPSIKTLDFIEYQGVHNDEDIVAIVAIDGETNPVVSCETLNTPDMEKTYIMGKWIDVPGEFWGMSSIERVEKPIYELNDRVNQTMDTTSQILNPMWLNSDADIQEGTLRIFPGRIINTSTDNGLKPLHPPVEILSPAYGAIDSLVSVIQDVSGATRFLGGSAQTPELQRTATGIMSIIKEANARLNLTIQGIEDNWVIPFLRRSYKYTQFYTERKSIVRIVGKQGIEFQQVDPATILGDYDFRPLGSQSVGSEEILTQQMINYLNIISRIPGISERFDLMKFIAKIGEKMLGLDDLDELILVNNREQEEIEKATSENEASMAGIPPTITANDNHALHKEIHDGFLKDPRSQEFPAATELLTNHLADHDKYSKGSGMMPIYNQVNRPHGGVPPQEMPRATNMEDITNQIAQPSQEGTI